MSIPQRFSLVTLGVADVPAATAFYRALGWRQSSASIAVDVSFFATPGAVAALWRTLDLARDAGMRAGPTPTFRAVAVAINLSSREEVDGAITDWTAAGGSVSRPAAITDWGGYSGYVADPDGNQWELAHNPFWPLDERGLPIVPGPAAD